MELGHQPYHKGHTYEEWIGNAARKKVGNKRWRKRLRRIIAQLEPIWNFDRLYLGGGNAKKINFELPDKVELFINEQGMRGGVRLWDDTGNSQG